MNLKYCITSGQSMLKMLKTPDCIPFLGVSQLILKIFYHLMCETISISRHLKSKKKLKPLLISKRALTLLQRVVAFAVR